jgi:nucleoside-diphosphate-sugar epimerase
VDDLADLYVLAVAKAPAGSLFHGSNGKTLKLRELAEAVAQPAGVAGKVQLWPVEEARKVTGPFVDGFVLDQEVVAPFTQQQLGWQPKAPFVTEEITQQKKPVVAQ